VYTPSQKKTVLGFTFFRCALTKIFFFWAESRIKFWMFWHSYWPIARKQIFFAVKGFLCSLLTTHKICKTQGLKIREKHI
jgi:hypothetical protein